ncbi:MAG TPA: hypothetical protein VHZ05_00860, partial [Acidimicrobiales bacterium]|nr:hypothetical protein [Acidimicrobiales bacterium]
PQYLSRKSTDGLTTVRGELRSGHRANMLMGVTSNRVDVKRQGALAERELERRAEPFAALFQPAEDYPSALLNLAWREMVRNSAHDSICACSVDEVVDAVLHRYAEARAIGAGLADRAVKSFARSLSEPGPSVLNPSARTRSGVVELVVPADGPAPDSVQVLSERAGLPGSMLLDANTVRTMLGMLQGPRISDDAWIHDVRIVETEEGLDITIAVGTEEKPNVPIAEAKQEVFTKLGARPDMSVRVAMDQPATRRIVARAADVPGYGWTAFAPAPLAHAVDVTETHGGSTVLGNGVVRVEIDHASGTFALDGVAGYGQLVDGGDLGDSYNYSPPGQDSFVDVPRSVEVLVSERGPVRARAQITASYAWPDHVDGSSQARVGEHLVEVRTDMEVRADEPTVRLTTSFVNPSGDHRLRVHLPLPEPASESHAESAFTVVTRGLTAEGRVDEYGLPTAPAQRFVSAGRLTAVHEGVCEYELIDVEDGAAKTMALTVLRSTGMLSRLGMAYRPFPAGPMTPVEGLQMRGKHVTLRYALMLDCEDPYSLADDVLLPLEATASLGGGTRPSSGTELTVDGAEVSALHRVAGALELRVYNPRPGATTVSIPGRSGWLVDLRGYPQESFEGSFELRPFGIATARLRAD